MDETRPVGSERAAELLRLLSKYRAGKARTDKRIISSENWWKLRNTHEEQLPLVTDAGFHSASGWLHNVITSKHADAVDAMPTPLILPREESDTEEAKRLSSVIPCILDRNGFEKLYSEVSWQKLKTGTGAYKLVWDRDALNGLGDIAIERVNLLELFWEPGVSDIQKSAAVFHTELRSAEAVKAEYPELASQLVSRGDSPARFAFDDSVDTSDKLTVVECYYKKWIGDSGDPFAPARLTVQYVKMVGETVLYATENEPEWASRGLYDHGKYPFVLDALFPIEGSPCGYGYVDLCRNPQTAIDLMNTAIVRNAMAGAVPRFFQRADGSVNEEEFLDMSKPIVHVTGNLGEDSIRQIRFSGLDGVYVGVLDRMVQELRETSGNTETSTGNISSGVTAAAAIAALQEASGKGSRDSTASAYRAFGELVTMMIELIRQFYTLPRQFRITGEDGSEQFVSYSNSVLLGSEQGSCAGVGGLWRVPCFDVKVSAQKKSVYSAVAQNEMAMELFRLGLFRPEMRDQALMCIDMMDFEGKEKLRRMIAVM